MQIFPNEIINALKIALSIKQDNLTIAFVASMQSGKSKTIYVLFNYILPNIGLLKDDEIVLFLTSMTDKDLYNQNLNNIEREFYCFNSNKMKNSYLKVIKMNIFKSKAPIILRDFNVKCIVRDEDQYGCGQESTFDNIFFKNIRIHFPQTPLLSISATPYDILDSKLSGNEVDLVLGERPDEYFGITEMISEGLVHNLPADYTSFKLNSENKKIVYINTVISNCLKFFKRFDDGVGIIRVLNTAEALDLKKELEKISNNEYETYVIGSLDACDKSITDGISYLYDRVVRNNKKVILLIINALGAGKDLKQLKNRVRFGIELRKSQLANGSQGIPGRLCGYHSNKDFLLYANLGLLKHYSEFELDPEIYSDNNWRNKLYSDNKVKSLSTHTKFEIQQKKGLISPIIEINKYSIRDLMDINIRKELDFIDNNCLAKIISFFEPDFYNSIQKGVKLNYSNVTVRIASNYKQKNRVHQSWNSKLGSNFNGIFFYKQKHNVYGILINNYPIGHKDNPLDFCGIKVFKSGKILSVNQITKTKNISMYVD